MSASQPRHPFTVAWETWQAWSDAEVMRTARRRTGERGESLAVFDQHPEWTKGPGPLAALAANREVVDQLVEYEDEGQNPIGGAPFPMLGTILVSHVADAPGFVEARWTVKLHPVKSVPVIADTVGKLFGDTLPAGTDAAVREALPKTIDIGTDTTYLIETATGIVHRMVRIERKNIADQQETETTTLRLRQTGPAPE